MELQIEWDNNKNIQNQIKHNVSFEEALTVFKDPLSITIDDIEHSISEERFIDIGLSNKYRILIVVYTEQKNIIRIISSRLANKKELNYYEEAK